MAMSEVSERIDAREMGQADDHLAAGADYAMHLCQEHPDVREVLEDMVHDHGVNGRIHEWQVPGTKIREHVRVRARTDIYPDRAWHLLGATAEIDRDLRQGGSTNGGGRFSNRLLNA